MWQKMGTQGKIHFSVPFLLRYLLQGRIVFSDVPRSFHVTIAPKKIQFFPETMTRFNARLHSNSAPFPKNFLRMQNTGRFAFRAMLLSILTVYLSHVVVYWASCDLRYSFWWSRRVRQAKGDSWKDAYEQNEKKCKAASRRYLTAALHDVPPALRGPKTGDQSPTKIRKRAHICVVVVTAAQQSVGRKNGEYLTISLANVLQSMFYASNTSIARVDALEGTPLLVPYLNVLSVDHENNEEMKRWENLPLLRLSRRNKSLQNWHVAGREHFADALEICNGDEEWKADYTLIMEDDVLVTSDIVEHLRFLVSSVRDPGFGFGNWFYMRLFWTEYWQNWRPLDVPWIVLLSVIVGFCKWCVLHSVLRQRVDDILRKKCFSLSIKNTMRWIILCLFVGNAATLILMVGRQNWVSVRPSYKRFEQTDEFSSAVLCFFRNLEVDSFVRFVRDSRNVSKLTHVGTDNMLMKFVQGSHGERTHLSYSPALGQHLGRFSSNVEKNQGSMEYVKTSLTFKKYGRPGLCPVW